MQFVRVGQPTFTVWIIYPHRLDRSQGRFLRCGFYAYSTFLDWKNQHSFHKNLWLDSCLDPKRPLWFHPYQRPTSSGHESQNKDVI